MQLNILIQICARYLLYLALGDFLYFLSWPVSPFITQLSACFQSVALITIIKKKITLKLRAFWSRGLGLKQPGSVSKPPPHPPNWDITAIDQSWRCWSVERSGQMSEDSYILTTRMLLIRGTSAWAAWRWKQEVNSQSPGILQDNAFLEICHCPDSISLFLKVEYWAAEIRKYPSVPCRWEQIINSLIPSFVAILLVYFWSQTSCTQDFTMHEFSMKSFSLTVVVKRNLKRSTDVKNDPQI